MAKHVSVLLVRPYRDSQGGVADFYNTILPSFKDSEFKVKTLEIGSSCGRTSAVHFVTDQIRFLDELNKNPDLVHINPSLGWKSFLRDGLFAWQVKRKGLPLLVFFHGWNKKFESTVGSRLRWFFNRTFCMADGFIVLASEFEQKLRDWGVSAPIELGTTVVDDEYLLNGFDYEAKILNLIVKQRMKVLFLARLERGKGVFETVDAVKILIEKGLPVSLSIAGDGSIMQELKDYIETLDLPQGCLTLLGYISGKEKNHVFTEHDIYCLPSYGEGLPISVLEAMTFGLPVITCPVGGLVDMFKDGEMGFFVKMGNPVEIAKSIEKLIMNREKMLQISRYNYHFASDHFMSATVANHLAGVYKSVVDKNRDGFA